MSDVLRPSPDALLRSIQREEAAQKRGKLKVFLGMCPGVGKTYAMLQAGQAELAARRDAVIGYVETHGRKETDALTQGFETVPRRRLDHRGMELTEMDLDQVLSRRPQLALVDELAHTSAPGSRHPKRWQDVEELLEAGIDVFTTLNVQHVESRADTVRQITGAEIRETVPDTVLDRAVLELVDLPPGELVQRLRDGKVYVPERATAAAENFFKAANLTALRELALRLVADHVGEDTIEFRRADTTLKAWKTGSRLLVAVGPSPLSEALARWTRRMADELRCPWLAVHVEGTRALSEAGLARLSKNLETARELGAEVITTTDEDLARGLLRVARERNVTQIIFGKPAGDGIVGWLRSGRMVRRLMQESGDIDLHVIKAEKATTSSDQKLWQPLGTSNLKQYALAFSVIACTGILNLGLMTMAGPRVPGLVFLVAVVLLALFVGRGPVLMAGALSALAWNFFFLPPRFTFTISRAEDGILFGIYFVVALVLGQLVARIRAQADAERRREERSTALYELTRELASAGSRDEVVWHLVGQVNRVFLAPAAVSLVVGEKLWAHPDGTLTLSEKEFSVSDWAFRHRKAAGRFTDNLPGADACHLPMATEEKVFGVLAVALPGQHLPLAQRDLLETFARQAALVLDRVELRAAAEQTRLTAESERLSQVLLNSISHELRTPLAASTSAASALTQAEGEEKRSGLVAEIQEANARLNRIVGNLLDVARLESGKVVPRLDWYDALDLVQTTVRELRRELSAHPLKMELPPGPMLVRCDFSLMQHALSNLLVNAAVHTPQGTEVEVRAELAELALVLSVLDRGPGIGSDLLPRIFEKFTRGTDAGTGGSGLGLTIAKGFIEGQGGTISAANRPGGGAVFSLRLAQTEKAPALQGAV